MSDLGEESLAYHRQTFPGKIALSLEKPMASQMDLSLAYTPGVARPVLEIAKDPSAAYEYTSKGHLVAVISNGTAILGLGNKGALASKPVMEGKAVLFKKFANIDAFDIEVDEKDPDKLIEIIAAIAPTFGGINLEDIKAPECFRVEEELIKRLDIPVMHDDQHGTAIVATAGLLNALELAGKRMEDVRIVMNGAGSAAVAIAKFLFSFGVPPEHLTLCDSKGVIFAGRTENMNAYKAPFARETSARTLADAMNGADVFIGVSGPNVVTQDMLLSMAPAPIVFAMANPTPEIDYHVAHATRDDLILATGRSDHPNQVNNVLCFPFLFRGALDARATCINQEMKQAAAKALAGLAREPVPSSVLKSYGLPSLAFGKEYILPKPFDTRLLSVVSQAVADAAKASGVVRN